MLPDEGGRDIGQEVTEGISGIKSSGVGRMRGNKAGELVGLCWRCVRRSSVHKGEPLQHWHMVMGEESPVCVSLPF